MARSPATGTAAFAVEVLNEALRRDPEAITALVNLRVPCGESLVRHPHLQTFQLQGETRLGVLGLVNGILGLKSGGIGAEGELDPRTGRLLKIHKFVAIPGAIDLNA